MRLLLWQGNVTIKECFVLFKNKLPFSLNRSNLVTTGLDYTHEVGQHKDSLLHTNNRRALAELLVNIRIACCGGGTARLHLNNLPKKLHVAFLSFIS